MEKKLIKYSDTGSFSKLIIDYLNGNEQLKPFYNYSPKIESFDQAIKDFGKQKVNRKLLVEVITEQYSSISHFPSSISHLLNNNTFTVCTGHQLCLFTGPLYFIYKIISTINLAEELKKEYPDYNFVPVYWMASEDHDFEEINHIHLFGKKLEAALPTSPREGEEQHRPPAGKISTSVFKSVLDELFLFLSPLGRAGVGLDNANELIQLFSDAYLKNKNLADATRYLVNELFGKYGLVIIDADDKRLKKEFAEIIKDDILNNTNYKLVNETIEELKKQDIKPQVNPREINCLYMTDEMRERIILTNKKYEIRNTKISFTEKEIINEIEIYPQRFSPNVMLRPLYQQMILPNIAYVGGGAEVAYWLQYKAMFDHHKVNFPVLMLRNSALWIDEKASEQMKKFGFSAEELFEDADTLTKKFLNKNIAEEINLKEQEEKLKAIYHTLSAKTEKVDPTLKIVVEAELQKHLNTLKSIENKITRAKKQKEEVSVNQIKKLKEKLFPNGTLQERYDNFIPFYAEHGKDFIRILKDNLSPFQQKFTVLRSEKLLNN